jgi:hypothetical protein
MSYEQASSRRDHLTLTTKAGKIEFTEEHLDRVTARMLRDNELDAVSGGMFDAFLKIC